MLKLPSDKFAVAWPRAVLPWVSFTVLPDSAVPVSVGVVLLVKLGPVSVGASGLVVSGCGRAIVALDLLTVTCMSSI